VQQHSWSRLAHSTTCGLPNLVSLHSPGTRCLDSSTGSGSRMPRHGSTSCPHQAQMKPVHQHSWSHLAHSTSFGHNLALLWRPHTRFPSSSTRPGSCMASTGATFCPRQLRMNPWHWDCWRCRPVCSTSHCLPNLESLCSPRTLSLWYHSSTGPDSYLVHTHATSWPHQLRMSS